MKSIYRYTIFFLSVLIFLFGCSQSPQNTPTVKIDNESNYHVIADTIITDVVIKNPDQDEWTDYCLRSLKKDQLVNELFELVSRGQLTPYNFFSEEPMTIEDVKQIEENDDYSREHIGKVQFEEAWYLDPNTQKMVKKVHSIMLAYELYDSNNEIKGYKPVFKVYFNE